jgi:hypothetical protein
MRKLLMAIAAFAAIAVIPSMANAQASTATGALVGAGTGAIIAGPPGAIVGGIIGGTFGAVNEPHVYGPRVYVAPRARYRECWRDEWGRRACHYW